ncbi:PAS domain-containing protein [Salmonirosea aquatica]|uniref:PAS domain-containing protein n=1 Tax=Salmonirosea aquatica TaxID=2654236 RepID=A0A7C9FZR1_9BACT|nr:PAS domain-containing protein [Cytophagaceae bacterium SJW1-29]
MLDLPPTIHCNSFLDLNLSTPLLIGLEFSRKPTISPSVDWRYLTDLKIASQWDFDLRPALPYLKGTMSAIVVTDPAQKITWVSKGFTRMTGYEPHETYGKRPGFLQGEKTLPQTRQQIRQHLAAGQPFAGTIVNYRKSGEAYACAIQLFPVYNQARDLVNYIALEEEEPMDLLSI